MLTLALLAVLSVDGGTDAGLEPVDAGPPPEPVGWTWTTIVDGGVLPGAAPGVSDRIVMHIGEVAHFKLPLPIILMQCDEPLVTLGATMDTLLLTGVKAGTTRCGFWYRKNEWPHRTLELTVQ